MIEAKNTAGPSIAALPSPDGKGVDGKTVMVKSMLFPVKQVSNLAAWPTRRIY